METSRPTILIDSREKEPLVFRLLPSAVGTLATGDYSIEGFSDHFSVERKSIPDLVQSVTFDRDRFERELVRLRGYGFRRLIIIGAPADIERHRYRSRAEPKAVIASLTAFEIRHDVPVCWCASACDAARQIERWAAYWVREQRERARALLGRAHA